MRLLLLLNGSRERYASGADMARYRRWREYCSPGTELEIGYLPGEQESGGISREYAFGSGEAVAKLAALYPDRCLRAEEEGYDAVIIHCFADPGLEATRERTRIPIVGPGEITFWAAATLGRNIGVTVPSDSTLEHHWEQARALGLEQRIIGMEAINRPIGAYDRQDPAAMTEALLAAARKLVDRGADVVCPSGLAYIPVRVSAGEVSQRLGVPVLDPALLSVRTAEMLVEATRRR